MWRRIERRQATLQQQRCPTLLKGWRGRWKRPRGPSRLQRCCLVSTVAWRRSGSSLPVACDTWIRAPRSRAARHWDMKCGPVDRGRRNRTCGGGRVIPRPSRVHQERQNESTLLCAGLGLNVGRGVLALVALGEGHVKLQTHSVGSRQRRGKLTLRLDVRRTTKCLHSWVGVECPIWTFRGIPSRASLQERLPPQTTDEVP